MNFFSIFEKKFGNILENENFFYRLGRKGGKGGRWGRMK